MKIDIGSGTKVKQGFVGLDKEKYVPTIKFVCDLNKGILPFKNNSIEEISCEHLLEHLNNPELIVDEIYRVLISGHKAHIVVPYFSYYTSHVWCHKNYWSTACIKLFKSSCYHETKIEFTKVKISLHRETKGIMSLVKIPFQLIADWNPTIYERLFCYVFPMAEIHFELVK